MSEKKDELIHLILNENVSAIETLVDELLLTSDEVIELINKLLEAGELSGTLTEDRLRFYKSEVKLSEAPSIEREDTPPSFLFFNTRPATVTTIVGFIVLAGGLIVNAFSGNFTEQSIASILIFVGLLIMICGLFSFSQRKTPS
ncbi:MAG: hypothetical protein PVJ05_03855 [Candidatus Thorarchaeota archaeon]|jgi:hypothetical protein